MATLATTVRSMPLLAAAVAGGVASVALFVLPLKLGTIAACLLGLLAGLIVERWMPAKDLFAGALPAKVQPASAWQQEDAE
jgi:hypothetical protein